MSENQPTNDPMARSGSAPQEMASASGPKPVKVKRHSGLGTWAIVLGIIGILFGLIPATSGFGIFLGAIALILGGIGLLRKGARARLGAVFGALAIVVGIVVTASNGGRSTPASTSTPAGSPSASVSQAPAATPSVPAASQAPAAAPAPSAPAGTAAQLQALAAAKGYLASGIGFSQASLTAQLTSSAGNGFAAPDAQWAVEHSGADWNAEALKAAKGYLNSTMGFSMASLTDQLASSAGNQFTPDQAAYGVANSGADWNAEAVKAAKGYMASGMGFSRQSLIDQLTSSAGNKFTEAQAAYAADQVGLK